MIKYTLTFSKKFNKSFEKLEKNTQKQVQKALTKLSNDYASCDIVKLSGMNETYRLRTGNYRIIFERTENAFIIIVLDIKHRKEAYKDL